MNISDVKAGDFKKRYLHSPLQVLKWMHRANLAMLRLMFTGRSGIPGDFAERINLAVSGVNGCLYCSYLHTKLALKKGVTEEEARMILAGDIDNARANEAKALAFAQHFAETGGSPDKEAMDALANAYGEKKALGVRAIIDIIYAGNMCSNTSEASQAKAPEARGAAFFFTWILAAPVALFVKLAGGYKD